MARLAVLLIAVLVLASLSPGSANAQYPCSGPGPGDEPSREPDSPGDRGTPLARDGAAAGDGRLRRGYGRGLRYAEAWTGDATIAGTSLPDGVAHRYTARSGDVAALRVIVCRTVGCNTRMILALFHTAIRNAHLMVFHWRHA